MLTFDTIKKLVSKKSPARMSRYHQMSKMPDPRDLHMASMRFDQEVIEGYELPEDPENFKNAKVTKQGYQRAQRALASPDQWNAEIGQFVFEIYSNFCRMNIYILEVPTSS